MHCQLVCGSPEEMSHNILANADRILSILLASVFSNLFCFAITSSAVIQLLALTSGLLPVLRRAGTAARTVAETSRLTAAVSFPEELLHFGRSTLHATETSQDYFWRSSSDS